MDESLFPLQQQISQTRPIPRIKNSSTINKKDNTKTKSARNNKSCDNCRKRKIRCNANIQNPCSGCEKDDVECQFILARKKLGPPTKEYTASLEQRVLLLERLLEEEKRKNKSNNITSTLEDSIQDTMIHYDNSYGILTSDTIRQPLHESSVLSTVLVSSSSSASPPSTAISLATSITGLSQDLTNNSCSHVLNLIQEIPGLTLELTERMIEGCFFGFMNSGILVINKYEFLVQFYYQHPRPLNKYLFYTVCAVGCHFLPSQLKRQKRISRIGRLLRKKGMGAMEESYRRSNITTVQTLMLLAMLAPGSDGFDGSATNWLILGAAIRMSQDMGLLSDSNSQFLSDREIQMRRRVVYVLYVLDKSFSAASGKPFTISNDDMNVEFPLLYELEPVGGCYSIADRPLPKLLKLAEADIHEKKPIYNELVDMYSMARTVCRILTVLYTPKPTLGIEFGSDLDRLLIEMQARMNSYSASRNKVIHRVLYAGVILLRYQPITANITSEKNDSEIQLLDLCTMAANNIVESLDTLQLPEMPSMTDGLISLATSILLRNCNHTDAEIRTQARKNLKRCVDIYMRDEIADRSQTAIVLTDLVNQMSEVDTENITL